MVSLSGCCTQREASAVPTPHNGQCLRRTGAVELVGARQPRRKGDAERQQSDVLGHPRKCLSDALSSVSARSLSFRTLSDALHKAAQGRQQWLSWGVGGGLFWCVPGLFWGSLRHQLGGRVGRALWSVPGVTRRRDATETDKAASDGAPERSASVPARLFHVVSRNKKVRRCRRGVERPEAASDGAQRAARGRERKGERVGGRQRGVVFRETGVEQHSQNGDRTGPNTRETPKDGAERAMGGSVFRVLASYVRARTRGARGADTCSAHVSSAGARSAGSDRPSVLPSARLRFPRPDTPRRWLCAPPSAQQWTRKGARHTRVRSSPRAWAQKQVPPTFLQGDSGGTGRRGCTPYTSRTNLAQRLITQNFPPPPQIYCVQSRTVVQSHLVERAGDLLWEVRYSMSRKRCAGNGFCQLWQSRNSLPTYVIGCRMAQIWRM